MPRAATSASAAALAMSLAVLAGCASIPSSGPVRAAQDVRFRQQDAFIRRLAQPPRPGASPAQVVAGFLAASADFDGGHAVARRYLTPAAAAGWDPTRGVRVYADDGALVQPARGPSVTLDAAAVGVIDAEGSWLPAAQGARVRVRLPLTQVDGQWRIAAVDDGLLLKAVDVRRAYRRVNLYFVESTRARLVPDPVYLPIQQGLATAAVRALLRGPTGALRGAVHTEFPGGTRLAAGGVPIENGVAEVDLSGEARVAGTTGRKLLSAQLVWTLRALPDVRGVRLTVQRSELAVQGQGSIQSRDAWRDYDPDVVPTSEPLYVVRAGRLHAVEGTAVTAVPGAAGGGRGSIVDPAVAMGRDAVAMLSPDRRGLRSGRLAPDEPLLQRLRGNNFTAPSWDLSGDVWSVDRVRRGTAVRSVVHRLVGGTQPTEVEAPDLRPYDVRAFRLARDGARVAVVVHRQGRDVLLVGRVERGERIRIGGLRPVAPRLGEVDAVGWQSADRLAVLGRLPGAGRQVHVVTVGGAELVGAGDVLPTAAADGFTRLAAAPTDRIYAVRAGRLLRLAADGWRDAGAATDVVFPG